MRRAFTVGLLVLFAGACSSSKVPSTPSLDAAPPSSSPVPPDASTAAVALDAGAPGAIRKIDEKEACALPHGWRGSAKAGVAPFSRPSGSCDNGDPFCDWVDDPPKGDVCFVANKNIARAERESRGAARAAAVTSAPWDPRKAPKYMDRVDGHLHFTEAESGILKAQGLVVLDRLSYSSYAVAFHDVFQQQLPVYVGVDPIFNAVFQANQMILGEVEDTRLGPRLVSMLDRMRAALASGARYAPETREDLDVYLTVARQLLPYDEQKQPKAKGAEAEALVESLVEKVKSAGELEEVNVFGRGRMIDFSQFAPRGHYAMNDYSVNAKVPRPDYFHAMMWLSRIEWNLVSRSSRSSQPGTMPDPSETPREAKDALALADLVSRAGALGDLQAFEDVYTVFAGKREDVSVPALLAMNVAPNDPDAQTKVKAAVGEGFVRTARVHYMPEGATKLPVIATLFGPRIVPDIAPLTRLVHDRLPDRYELGAGDVAYVLGHDRAKKYVAPFSPAASLDDALNASRAEMAASSAGRNDVYSAWIGAVRHVADPPAGVVPSFMKKDAYADMKMSSALAGYAQIRHTFVLLAGQGYDSYGCEIPDGYVEPEVGVYEGLLAWSRAARSAVPARAAYFARVEAVLSQLIAISKTELSGAPLSAAQRRWLGMVSEFTPVGGYAGDSGEPPKWTGWYFDLFPDREHGAERAVDLVADYFTLTNAGQVRYVGVAHASLGAFVVDTGGEARVMVGPVVVPYEVAGAIAKRYDDAAARTAPGKRAPWTASYLAPASPAPPLAATFAVCPAETRLVVQSERALGDLTIELLDHHGDPIAQPVTHPVAAGEPVVFGFTVPEKVAEGVHYHAAGWDLVAGVSVYPLDDQGYPRAMPGMDVDLRPNAEPPPWRDALAAPAPP